MRRRFFVERFAGASARLEGEAARHLGRVLHAEPGQLYELSDGHSIFLARIESLARDRIDFALVESVPAPAAWLDISLLLAVVKFDRFEWALEKATELGVQEIVPLAADRSAKPLLLAAPKRTARWRKILLESAEQSRRVRPPVLQEVVRPAAAFAQADAPLKILLSENPSAVPLGALFAEAASQSLPETATAAPRRIAVAVGPEGGWTEQEFAAAHAAGFREGALGRGILRTETAVVAGLAAVHVYFDADGGAGSQISERRLGQP